MKHLAIVKIDLTTHIYSQDEPWMAEHRRRRIQIKTDLNAWKVHLIQVLKDSPSEERKFVRWRVSEKYTIPHRGKRNLAVVEKGELEVLPERPL